jgi:hypothetical protein
MATKRKLKPDTYRILRDALERGIPWGIAHYYKHRENEPEIADRDALADQILEAQLLEVCEVINFDD